MNPSVKSSKAFLNGISHKARNDLPDICQRILSLNRRNHLSQSGAFPSGTKVTKKLYRDLSLTGFVRRLFPFSLKGNPCQRITSSKIRRIHRDYNGTVGIAPVSGMVTHSVYRQTSLFRRGIDDISTGTHTERIHASFFSGIVGQLVICSG